MQDAPTTPSDIQSGITVTIVPGSVADGWTTDTVVSAPAGSSFSHLLTALKTFRSKDFRYTFDWVINEGRYDNPLTDRVHEPNQVWRAIADIKAHRESLKGLIRGLRCSATCSLRPRVGDGRFPAQWGREINQLAGKVAGDWIEQVDELVMAVIFVDTNVWRRLATWRPDHMVYALAVEDNSPEKCFLRG